MTSSLLKRIPPRNPHHVSGNGRGPRSRRSGTGGRGIVQRLAGVLLLPRPASAPAAAAARPLRSRRRPRSPVVPAALPLHRELPADLLRLQRDRPLELGHLSPDPGERLRVGRGRGLVLDDLVVGGRRRRGRGRFLDGVVLKDLGGGAVFVIQTGGSLGSRGLPRRSRIPRGVRCPRCTGRRSVVPRSRR